MQKLNMKKMLPQLTEHLDLTRPIIYAIYQMHINRYIFAGRFVQNKVILDAGCGSGAGSKYWVDKGAKRVTGIDIEQYAIKDAKAWNKEANGAEFVLANSQALPFHSNYFDVIICLESIEHLKEPEQFLLECKRVIKRDGIFICSTPNKSVSTPFFKKPSNPYHIKEFYPKEFYDFVRTYFIDVTLYGQHMLNIGDRIKTGLLTMVGLVLARMPGGDKIRKLLRKIGKFVLAESHLPRFREDIDEMADKDYKIVPFKEKKWFEVPETLVIVAKEGE
jgi:ubiquinone/menaquinone biosynthesis C-methylase UbiE